MTNKNFLEEICRANIVGAKIAGHYISVPQPTSIREAEKLGSFWNPIFENKKDDIQSINFVYQEEGKELPLSYGKKFLKKLGIKIEPKIKEGEIKFESINREQGLFYGMNYDKNNYFEIILNKDSVEKFEKIKQNFNNYDCGGYLFIQKFPRNFSVIMNRGILWTTHLNIPLECITKIEFRE